MMNNVILPYLMSMLLGRTIDLRTYTISGLNVYDDAEYDETPARSLNTTYNVMQEDTFPYDFFGVPVDIATRIKSGFLTSKSGPMGLDGVLKDTSWKYNSAIVSTTTLYRTVDRSIAANATMLPDWKDRVPATQTHYAKTLFYGGWLVVLFRFQCDIASDVVSVRKTLTKHLGSVGELTEDTVHLWNQAIEGIRKNDDIRGTVRLHTHIYSTTPVSRTIDKPEDLMQTIKELPENVGPLGQPLYMDLRPLNDLDEKYPQIVENIEMVKEIEKLDQMFDDVKITKVSLLRWVTETLTVFDDDQEQKIAQFLHDLNVCIKAFSKIGSEISLFKPTEHSYLDNAFQKYIAGLPKGIGTYNLAFRRMKEDIDAQCENAFLHRIRGLLRVYDNEYIKKGEVKSFQECQKLCLAEDRCRSIGFAEHLSELDLATGLYLKKKNQCWIYFRSTSTATVNTPNGLSGDMGVYDRLCY